MADAVYNRIPDLVNSFIKQDNNSFEITTLTLIRLLEKRDDKIAQQLKKILSDYRAGNSHVKEARSLTSTENRMINLTIPSKKIKDLVTSKAIHDDILEVIKSHEKAEELYKVGLNPISKVLFSGPSGTGKSTAAEVIAAELRIPLYRVNTAQLLSSYLGDTSKNVDTVIEFVRTHRVVLLLDEFDSIGMGREENNDIGEMRRIVNTLLQSLDSWENQGIFIATTNRVKDVDGALMRRFDFNVQFAEPDEKARYLLWNMYIGDYVNNPILEKIARMIDNISPADIEVISHRALRQSILKESDVVQMLIKFLTIFIQKSSYPKNETVKTLKALDPTLTLKQLAKIVDSSTSSVGRYLKS
ncbi:AAA family ATPase [Levilactobacillus brevis]|uniref:AAA family ATPase n=1 Tax=Levilactobacillus brevis TaxID=1580 RepID=UPI000A2FEB67|nr:ATP-binding protein [Levilactobacillus brevis]ARQ94255.1 cell division protein FtsH [Levilactobacillus brevis]ARW22442.1 Cell division control protein 48 like protein [Levilactobacillus brevis]PUD96654.1 ATP-binding protein [Levilactobacillus brevis]ULH73584.1 ATP-binding protein [Levilactobacillus brevis]